MIITTNNNTATITINHTNGIDNGVAIILTTETIGYTAVIEGPSS